MESQDKLLHQLLSIKVTTLFVLLISSLIASVLPWIIAKKASRAANLFSMMNCVSSGVVLGAAFSHMLPEATESFLKSLEGHSNKNLANYPFAFLFAAISLLILLTIEKIFLDDHSVDGTDGHSHSHCDISEENEGLIVNHSKSAEELEDISSMRASSDGYIIDPKLHKTNFSTHQHQSEELNNNTHEVTHTLPRSATPTSRSVKQAYVFLGALSVHSIFEGLGLGAETSLEGVWSVLLAVVSHKMLEAFALGLSIYRASFKNTTSALLVGFYCIATPLGIAVGISVGVEGSAPLISGALTSLAAGSFFYISLIEMIPAELRKPSRKKTKLALIIAGWAFMAMVAYWA